MPLSFTPKAIRAPFLGFVFRHVDFDKPLYQFNFARWVSATFSFSSSVMASDILLFLSSSFALVAPDFSLALPIIPQPLRSGQLPVPAMVQVFTGILS
jgi:hypothetical protein